MSSRKCLYRMYQTQGWVCCQQQELGREREGRLRGWQPWKWFLLEGTEVFLIKGLSGPQQVWLQAGKQQPGGQEEALGTPLPAWRRKWGWKCPPEPCWDTKPGCRVTAGAFLGHGKGKAGASLWENRTIRPTVEWKGLSRPEQNHTGNRVNTGRWAFLMGTGKYQNPLCAFPAFSSAGTRLHLWPASIRTAFKGRHERKCLSVMTPTSNFSETSFKNCPEHQGKLPLLLS